jgi:hypothetical protein
MTPALWPSHRKCLSRITEEEDGSTELVEYSHTAETSLDRQVYMAAEDDELGSEYDVELLIDVSINEHITNAPQDKNKEHSRIRWLKNAKRGRNTKNRAHNLLYHRNLNNAFAAVEDREYCTLIGAIAKATLLVQQLPPNPQVQRMQNLTQHAVVQLDEQNPKSSALEYPLKIRASW